MKQLINCALCLLWLPISGVAAQTTIVDTEFVAAGLEGIPGAKKMG